MVRSAKTSRAEIIDHAYKLALSEGLRAVTVRRVAREMSLAPGSILNYLPSKADLIGALVARYFKEALFEDFCKPEANELFVDYVERLHMALRATLSDFKKHWAPDLQALPDKEKQKVEDLEKRLFDHMVGGLTILYKRDKSIRPNLPEAMSAERISSFVVHELVSSATPEQSASMIALLRMSLY